jgi:hypothetical protein
MNMPPTDRLAGMPPFAQAGVESASAAALIGIFRTDSLAMALPRQMQSCESLARSLYESMRLIATDYQQRN